MTALARIVLVGLTCCGFVLAIGCAVLRFQAGDLFMAGVMVALAFLIGWLLAGATARTSGGL